MEDALAAALEHPEVWPQLSRAFGWHTRLPQSTPTIRVQFADAAGRTDIELIWPDAQVPTLILELKVHAPPTIEQLRRYLTRDNALVVGIGSWSNEGDLRASLSGPQATRFLGVITWEQIRQLRWESAPLEYRQLQHLLDAVGVTMPRANGAQLTALRSSLPLWAMLDRWIPDGLSAIRTVCAESGLSTTRPNGPNLENGWYAGWLGGRSSVPTELTIWGGFILVDESNPPLSDSFPDIALQLEIDTRSVMNRHLQEDSALTQAVEQWVAGRLENEVRTDMRAPSSWGILSTRTSSAILLESADQRATFVGWLMDAATALAEHGILQRITALAQATATQSETNEEE